MQTIFCGSERDEKKEKPCSTIANDIIAAYKPESVEEMHEAIKDVFGPMFEAIG